MKTRVIPYVATSTITSVILGTGIPYIADCRRRDIFPGPRRFFNVTPRLFFYGLFGVTKGEDIAKRLFHSQPDKFFTSYDAETTELFRRCEEGHKETVELIKRFDELDKQNDENINQYKRDINGR